MPKDQPRFRAGQRAYSNGTAWTRSCHPTSHPPTPLPRQSQGRRLHPSSPFSTPSTNGSSLCLSPLRTCSRPLPFAKRQSGTLLSDLPRDLRASLTALFPLPQSPSPPARTPLPGLHCSLDVGKVIKRTMAGFFSKRRDEEKGSDSPPPGPEVAGVQDTAEEGLVDEAQDDLHRGMKPRQLSGCLLSCCCARPVRT